MVSKSFDAHGLARFIGVAVHRRDSGVQVGTRGGDAIGAGEIPHEAFHRPDRGVTHVGPGSAEVERHDRPCARLKADPGGVGDQATAVCFRAGFGRPEGDRDLQSGILLLDFLRALRSPVCGCFLLRELPVLDVHVDRPQGVGLDHLLVGPREGRGAFARAPPASCRSSPRTTRRLHPRQRECSRSPPDRSRRGAGAARPTRDCRCPGRG